MWELIREFVLDHSALFFWIGVGSAAMFVLATLGAGWLVARIPHDYFTARTASPPPRSASAWTLKFLKNIAGWGLIIAGILMLVLPGQGVLTILAGLMLVDFYGKRRLEVWILTRASVRKSIEWLRRRSGQPRLEFPEETLEPSD